MELISNNRQITTMQKILQIKLFSVSVFAMYKKPGLGWVRVFGYGFHWKCFKRNGLYFSERIGKSKYAIIFGYVFSVLRPNKF